MKTHMKTHGIHLLILLTVCSIAFGFKAGERHFWGRHGESRRAEVSREMVVSGNWVVPHINGEPFVTKPPLFYWAVALMFTARGQFDELSARLPSFLAGTLGVLLTYFWANAMFSARVGLLAGIMLATNFLYGGMTRSSEADIMLTLFTTAALYFFTLGYLRRRNDLTRERRWNYSTAMYALAAVSVGLGNMTKNPIGLAVPLLTIAIFILLTRDIGLLVELKPWWMIPIVFLVMLPWFVLVYLRVPDFLQVLYQETLGRYANPLETPHYEPFYYYIPALGAFAPWILFFPGACISAFSQKRQKWSRAYLLVVIAFAATFLLFSSVGSKREYYLLPLYPALAILVAKYWDEYLTRQAAGARRWSWKGMDIPLAGLGALFCLVGIALPIASKIYLPHYFRLSVLFGSMLAGCGLGAILLFRKGKGLMVFGLYTAAVLLIYVFGLLTIVPEMDIYRSRKAFLQKAAALAGDAKVIDYKYESYALQFYMQRIIPVIEQNADDAVERLTRYLDEEKRLFVIVQAEKYDALSQAHPELVKRFTIVLDRTWRSATDPKRQRRLLLLQGS